jgi:hypothetical protein
MQDMQHYEWIKVDGTHTPLQNVPGFNGQDVLAGHYEYHGKIAYDEDGNMYCPVCGEKMEAYFN